MDLVRHRLLASPALAEDQHARAVALRDAVDALLQRRHHGALSDELASAVAVIVRDRILSLRIPRGGLHAGRDVAHSLCVQRLVLVVAVVELSSLDEGDVGADVGRRLLLGLQKRHKLFNVDSKRLPDRFEQRGVVDLGLHQSRKRGSRLLWHLERAYPRRLHAARLQPPQRVRKPRGIARHRDADDVYPLRPPRGSLPPFAPLGNLLHELGEPPAAHAADVGVSPERLERSGSRGHVLDVPPAGQYEIIRTIHRDLQSFSSLIR